MGFAGSCEQKCILVIDDEPAMRSAMRIILSRSGYEVLTADSADDALMLLASNSRITLVICDLFMPGMNLPEFVTITNREYPALPKIYCSGFPKSRFDSLGIFLEDEDFISKPFMPDELRAKVCARIGK